MVQGELEDQCQSHPAGAALSAGTNQVNLTYPLNRPPFELSVMSHLFLQQVWDPDEMRMLNWERNRHYILEAPQRSSGSFSCPKFASFQILSPLKESQLFVSFCRNKKDSLVRLWAEQDRGKYRLQKDGSLQVVDEKILQNIYRGWE